MKKLCFLLLFGAAACTQQPTDHFILRGTVPGVMDSTKVTLRTVTRWDKDLASAYVIDGKFELRGQLDAPTLCKLSLNNARSYELDFFVENGKLTFTTPHIDSLPQAYGLYDIRKEKNYRVEGSTTQDAYYRYQQQTLPLRYGIQELRKQANQIPDYNSRLEDMNAELDKTSRAFIRNNDNLATNLYIAGTLKKPAFTYDQTYLDELEQLFASCQDTCAALKDFRSYLRDASRLVQGSPLQEAEVVNDKGESVSLIAQLNREGYTLIDFWASWCGPCRAENPNVIRLYKKYHRKGLEVVGFSLDDDKSKWVQAIMEDGLPWINGSDLKGQSSEIGRLYNVRSIPFTLLLDENNRIVGKNLRGKELTKKIEELLKSK